MSQEIFEKFMDIYNRAKEKMGDEMATWNKVYQFEIEGMEPFYIEFKGGDVRIEEGKVESPLATLRMDREVLMKILDLEIDPMVAFMRGQMKITGNVMETVHLRKMFQILREE